MESTYIHYRTDSIADIYLFIDFIGRGRFLLKKDSMFNPYVIKREIFTIVLLWKIQFLGIIVNRVVDLKDLYGRIR